MNIDKQNEHIAAQALSTIHTLDHGFLALMDYMGEDLTPAHTARTSYANDTGLHTEEKDKGLVKYLINHGHNTPVEMCEMRFYAEMPMFVARQWVRHRTASINEVSARYTKLSDKFYVPDHDRLKKQSTANKQGSGESLTDAEKLVATNMINEVHREAYMRYEHMIDKLGVASELARIVLPVSVYTAWEWKCDLHNILNNFLRERMENHAQWEIQQYAIAMCSMVRAVYPTATEAAYERWCIVGGQYGMTYPPLPEPAQVLPRAR